MKIIAIYKFHYSFLCIILLFSSCNPTEPLINNKTNQWNRVSDLDGVDIWDVKIFSDEIYVAGKDSQDRGVIYKSSDAIHWEIFSPSIRDSLDRGVGAIDLYEGNLIACFSGKPIYLVKSESIIPLSRPILNEVRNMIVDKDNNIIIGIYNNYYCKYVISDSIYNIYDSLYTPPTDGNCYKQAGIVGISVSTFLKDRYSNDILIGNYSFNNHYVTTFHDRTIDCFVTEGLSQSEKYFGCHDLIFAGDTLLAAGYAGVKYLAQNVWKNYGDTLPSTPDGRLTIATCIAYNEINKEIYVAANYIGVVKWEYNSEWISMNEGLESFQGYYDFISNIICFKGILLLTYGTSKTYQSTSRGAMFYSIK